MPPANRYSQDSVDIAVLKTDMAKLNGVVDKLDTTLDKMEQLLSNTVKMIALHEQKFDYQDQMDSLLRTMNDKEQTAQEEAIKALEKRVESVENRLDIKFQEIENKIIAALDTKINTLASTLSKQEGKKNIIEKLGLKKISSKWYYTGLGGAAVIWWMLSNIDLVQHILAFFGGSNPQLPIGKR